MFKPIDQHLALHLLIINQWYMSRHALGLSHMNSKVIKKTSFFKPFVISKIILCPYLLNSTDKMKLLFHHTLGKYNWPVI